MDEVTPTVLEHLPKKTPIWAIGITTVIVAVTSCLVTIYFVAKDDIHSTLTWGQTQAEKKFTAEHVQQEKALDSVLAVVNQNMVQLGELNKALAVEQVQASNLEIRVAELENAVNRLKTNLSECQSNLKTCLESKK